MKFFDSADELIETIETLRHKYYHGSTFIPELCLDREKIRDSRYLDWYYQLLDTSYFQSIDLTGNELISTDLAVPLYREAEKKGLILKAHFAESYFSDNNLIDIKNLHLNEIQHGNMLIDDENAIKYLKENNIQLNICPSSNYFLSNVKSLTQHPIGKLYQKNIRVTINSDDQLIFGSSVSNEYLNLFKNKVLNPEELNQIRLIGLGVL
jgi:adenosine deaminase